MVQAERQGWLWQGQQARGPLGHVSAGVGRRASEGAGMSTPAAAAPCHAVCSAESIPPDTTTTALRSLQLREWG